MILTSQPSREMVKQLEKKLQDIDLVSLRRIQVIEVLKRDFLEPEDMEQCVLAEEPSSGEWKAVLGKLQLWAARQPLVLALVQPLPLPFGPFNVP